jgi:hypothetical protein
MSSDGSVTHWLRLLQAGDHDAARPLWVRYFRLLLARGRAAPRRVADEEDVALSAFDSFCRRAEQGLFPQLNDRDGLWRVLLALTARTAARLARDESRARRGGGKVRAEADLPNTNAEGVEGVLARVMGDEPTPDLAVQVTDRTPIPPSEGDGQRGSRLPKKT